MAQIVEKKKKKLKSIFLTQFIEEINWISQHETKIFTVLDELAADNPDVSHRLYLKNALLLLENVEKSFVEMRSYPFFRWLIEKLSLDENKKVSFEKSNCYIEHMMHFVSSPFQSKKVLGFFIEFYGSFIEIESLQQILLKKHQNVHLIEESSFQIASQKRKKTIFYLEVQKKEGTLLENNVHKLQKDIHETVCELITRPTYEISLENHEFSMKTFHWIMSELKEHDLPHVFIDFTKQKGQMLQFSVLVCRIKEKHLNSLEKELNHPQIHVEWKTEKKEPMHKEGIILKIEIPCTLSFSLVQARYEVKQLLESLIGSFRDFNGGLLEKIEENFHELMKHVAAPPKLLRDFFDSITPEENRATFPAALIKVIYLELEKQKQNDLEMNYAIEESSKWISITIKMLLSEFEKEWKQVFSKAFPSILFSSMNTSKTIILNSFLLHPTLQEQKQYKKMSLSFYKKWSEKKEIKQVLHLCSSVHFTSFDPRTGTEEQTSYLHKMLFEGLMRIGSSGKIEPAIAEKVEVTNEGKQYRFFLRKSFWSNGIPLTAHDFAYSWKMTLTPGFLAPLSYLFDVIKNAKKVKEGRLSSDCLGVQVVDDHILDVTLCNPCPSFLEICTLVLFSPICQVIDVEHPNWSEAQGKDYICNGPFTLEKKELNRIILKKNPFYWESQKVRLEQVNIFILTEEESVSLFQKKQIDALLYPFCKKQVFIPSKKETTVIKGGLSTRYLCMDCSHPPFHNKKIRKALSLVLNRQKIAKEFSLDAIPHYSFYSPHFSKKEPESDLNDKENIALAQKFFIEALSEDPTLRNMIYDQTIHAWHTHKPLADILAKQINQILGINWKTSTVKESPLRYMTRKKHFQLFIYTWSDRINNPRYFLQSFTSKKNFVNFSFWGNKKIQSIIEESHITSSEEKLQALYHEAENLLFEEMPIIPLFYTHTYSLCHSNIKKIYASNFQQFDIRYAHK